MIEKSGFVDREGHSLDTEGATKLKEFFYCLVQSIADKPELVEVVQQEQLDGIVVKVFVAEDDFQRFCEQNCRTLHALNTVLSAMAKRDRIAASIEVAARSATARVN